MEGKENIPVSNIRNSIESLQKERSKAESYLYELIEMRKSLEVKADQLDVEISQLNEEANRIEASKVIVEFKAAKQEKDADQLEQKNKSLAETYKNLQSKMKGYKEKRSADLERFENEIAPLCERFATASSIYNENSIQAETEKVYKDIEEIGKEYEEMSVALNNSRMELDDLILYQAPYNAKELGIPLAQRKTVLSIFEDAQMEAEARIENFNHVAALKEAELKDLVEAKKD
ncbi:hypothetical protein JTE90_014643 [Oedothorax gibbosus]|uniref:Uncharacterized protein n=1 Tax=Oedothorax gibbosus TaxID=931172 RepID=A0AAV6V8C7_9ARAC|nr:hypothetical protein JTE90_014643 [Oedothorax gibbosus]